MKAVIQLLLTAGLLVGLPLSGVWLAGYDLEPYLEFPPRTRYVEHAPFSWPVFIGLILVILAVMVPFLLRVIRAGGADAVCPGGGSCAPSTPRTAGTAVPTRRFPRWGWLALALGILFWVLAWTRFTWFAPLQLHTFTPLWLCYIAVINALTYRRTGRCLMTHDTAFFLKLFLLSAAFWWFFEYLNRFVQNWYYVECVRFTPMQYFIAATLPFSTVLPAVLSTEEWLESHPRTYAGLESLHPLDLESSRPGAILLLAVSSAGLLLIGIFPDLLYPLLWVAPLLVLVALQTLSRRPPFFPGLKTGDWRRVFRLALAALICGFFWEMWNSLSLAKWIYAVPYVHRFQLFEMPLPGYAGYLPFGLECAAIAALLQHPGGRNHD